MSKREEFVKLPPYVDFREKPPVSAFVYRCTCGYSEPWDLSEKTHVTCPSCKGVAVRQAI